MPEGFRFCHALRVRYSEIDGQMIVFNGHYLTFMDVAVTEYFRNLGLTFTTGPAKPEFDMALVKTTLEFKEPAVFDDILDIYVRVSGIGNASFTVEFTIEKRQSGSTVLLAQTVYVNYNPELKKSAPVPDRVRSLIDRFESSDTVIRTGCV